MKRFFKNNAIVSIRTPKKDTVVLMLKSPCRHYSSVTMKVHQSENGTPEFFIADTEFRCGMRRCLINSLRG